MDIDQPNKFPKSTEDFKDFVESVLGKYKADDIVSIDISKKSKIASYIIIASGKSGSHVKSLAEYVKEAIRPYKKLSIEGIRGVSEVNWVVINFCDVIVHIFRPEVREYYKLEELWNCQAVKDNSAYMSNDTVESNNGES